MRGRPRPSGRGPRRVQEGRAEKDVQVRGDPQRVRQLRAMQGAPQRGAVAVFRIARHRRDREPGRADLPDQRQGQAPPLLKAGRGGNLGPRACGGRQPRVWQIQPRAQQPCARARPQRDGHRRLTIGDLAQRATILPGDAHRGGALFGKAGAVEDQHTATLGHDRPQACPQRLGVPRRLADEVLERLVAARLAEPRPHRRHRFAATVAQHAQDIPTHRAPLRPRGEAVFEPLQPREQASQPRRRGAIEHRRVA